VARKIAIVLRGPPGSGKTEVAQVLEGLFSGRCAFVNLDQFWVQGEKRFVGSCRYWDLDDPRDVLIIELGYGEPWPRSFDGATRNPKEWLRVLQNAKREVFLFRLDVPVEETLARTCHRMRPIDATTAATLYGTGHDCSTEVFTERAAMHGQEVVIDTSRATGLTLAATVKVILDKIGPV
jgi:thymidylate kinase